MLQLEEALVYKSAPIPCNSDLHLAWANPYIRTLICQIIQKGFFAAASEVGAELATHLESHIAHGLEQDEIYKQLRLFVMNHSQSRRALQFDREQLMQRRVKQISGFLGTPIRSLLDYGNGNGEITASLARHFGLNQNTALGLDSVRRASPSKYYSQLIQNASDRLPAPNRKYQTATMLMVLHHLPDYKSALQYIHGALESGAQLLIRESDVPTWSFKNFHAVMEDFYYKVLGSYPQISIPNTHMPFSFWIQQIQDCGFELQRLAPVEDKNPFAPVYAMFTRQQ